MFEKYKESVDEAKERIARLERQGAADRSDAATVRVQNMELETRLQVTESRLKSTERERDALRTRLESERVNNRKDREDAAMAMRRHAELLTENDRLRNELGVQTIGQTAPAPTPAADPKPAAAEDGRDASEIRASLLELD